MQWSWIFGSDVVRQVSVQQLRWQADASGGAVMPDWGFYVQAACPKHVMHSSLSILVSRYLSRILNVQFAFVANR